MNTPLYKVGDVVIINKPKDVTEYPEWFSSNMDYLADRIWTIQSISHKDQGNKAICYRIDGWHLNEKWLIPVSELGVILYAKI
jgi:hypothetical protein